MTTYHKNKEDKMLSRKKRIKQMNFQIQERRVEELSPLTEDDKYIIEMACLLYTSPSPRDVEESRMPSSA